jgi:hypothetical protein
MRQEFVSPAGTDLVAISLPAGQIRGITVDNPTGSWLHLYPTYDYIPPYTINWARELPGDSVSLTLRFEDGPNGQQSSLEGGPIMVMLDSDPVAPSPGVDQGQAYRPITTSEIITATNSVFVDWLTQIPVITSATVGNRVLRVYQVRLAFTWTQSAITLAAANMDQSLEWRLTSDLAFGVDYFQGMISRESPVDTLDFSNQPFDLQRGRGIGLWLIPHWSKTYVSYSVRYSLV